MDRCQDHDKISEAVIRMEEKLDAAIKEVGGHIAAGSKWRLAILCACIGLIGTFVAGVVRFGVMEYKVTTVQEEQIRMKDQIYDLNYEKGRAVGMQETK
jgi:hypothetical protein